MSKLTDVEIQRAISKLHQTEQTKVTLTEGAERGAGRLTFIARRVEGGVTSEFYAQWYRNGARQMTKLGSYPSLKLAAARKLFREEYMPQILKGANPKGPRVWVKRADPTLGELAEAYLADMGKRGCSEGSIRAARYCLIGPSGIVTKVGPARLAASITADDVNPYLAEKSDAGRHHQGNNMLAFLRAAFRYAIESRYGYHRGGAKVEWGVVQNPLSCIPADPLAFVPGQRRLSEAEFKAFWDWLTIKGCSFRYRFAPAMQMLMATGQRASEILRLSIDDFDASEKTISWSTTKNKKPHCIPLPRQALAIITSCQANEHGLFFSRQGKRDERAPADAFRRLIDRYLSESGATPFTARDLRRTWKTLAGKAGLSKEIRDRIQNHALGDVATKHYDRYDYLEPKRAAMGLWDSFLANLLTGDPNGIADFARPVRVTKDPYAAPTTPFAA